MPKKTNQETKRNENISIVLREDSWTMCAPFTQAVAVEGMKSTDNLSIAGFYYPENLTRELKQKTDVSIQRLTKLETENGYFRATCEFDKPQTDINIILRGE